MVRRKTYNYDEVRTFILCPRRLKYQRKYPKEFLPIEDAFQGVIHDIIDRLIYSGIVREGILPLKQFSRGWRIRWKELRKTTTLQEIEHSTYESLLRRGERYIRNFYVRFSELCKSDTHPQGMVHNFYYRANIPGGYAIRGKMDLLYPTEKGSVIVKLRMEDKANLDRKPVNPAIHSKLDREPMLWAIGFRSTLFHPPHAISNFYLCDGTEYIFHPEDRDYLRMKKYYRGLCADMYYHEKRNVGLHCFDCPYQSMCIYEEEYPNESWKGSSTAEDVPVEQ